MCVSIVVPQPKRPEAEAVLARLGFQKSGRFNRENELNAELKSGSNSPGVYAFVTNGRVKYIDETRSPLSRRMNQYTTPGPSQLTNIRVHNEIKKALTDGLEVDIWFQEEAKIGSSGIVLIGTLELPVNRKVLESTLIEYFGTVSEWNRND